MTRELKVKFYRRVVDEHLGGTCGPAERAAQLPSHPPARRGSGACHSNGSARCERRQTGIHRGFRAGNPQAAVLALGSIRRYWNAVPRHGCARHHLPTDRFPHDKAGPIADCRDRIGSSSLCCCAWCYGSNRKEFAAENHSENTIASS